MLKFSKNSLIIIVLFLGTLITTQAQNKLASIAGKVNSEKGELLEGVNITLKGEFLGTTSNEKGKFVLQKIKPGKHTVQISFLGFESQELEINLVPGERFEINFQLKEAPYRINEVQLSGKSAIRQINEQAYAVTSVSAQEFYNSTSDAKQILDRIPGVRILQEGGLGSNLDFSLNGFSGDQVKFFLNGIPMDNFGSSFNLGSIPVNSIERIDVYKGVVPVWLGTDALGGAVNIITNQKNDFLDASYSIGSFNTHRASVNGAYTHENGFTVRGNINYNYSDNDYSVFVDIKDELGNIEEEDVEVNRFHDRYRSLTANVETGWIDKSFADQLLFGVIASGDDNQRQNGATMAHPYGGVVTESRSIIPTLKYKKQNLFWEGFDVSLNSALNLTETKNIDTLTGVRFNWYGQPLETGSQTDAELGTASLVTMDDREFTTQLNSGYLFNDQHSLALNYSYQNFHRNNNDELNPDKPENKFPNTLKKNILGLSYKLDVNQKWSTTLFGKSYFLNVETSKEYDSDNQNRRIASFESNQENFGYGVATSYFIFPQLQVKASFEHTYRLPTATELLGNGFDINSNVNLQPEESDNYNLGFIYNQDWQEKHSFKFEGNFIYRNAENLIYNSVQGITSTKINLDKARALGAEGSINYSWKEFFQLGINMTYQDITDQADKIYDSYSGYQENFNKGERIPNTPYLFGAAKAGLRFKNVGLENSLLNLNYTYNYVEEFYFSWQRFGNRDGKSVIPQQTSHDLELVYSFGSGKYNIGLECRNFTDNLLYDKFRLQKPGRAFFLKFRYSINH